VARPTQEELAQEIGNTDIVHQLAVMVVGSEGPQTDRIEERIRAALPEYIYAIADDTLSGREESRDEFYRRRSTDL
jgi:hypothetical protein